MSSVLTSWRGAWRKCVGLLRNNQPLTLRGLIASGGAFFVLRAYAASQYDLTAYMVGGGVLALVAAAALGGLFFRIRMSSSTSVRLTFSADHPVSKAPISAGIRIDHCRVPPFFRLRVDREFTHTGPTSPAHLVSGPPADLMGYRLLDTVTFPHRGYWTASGVLLRLEDVFGFSRYRWRIGAEETVEVSAPEISIRELPIAASSARGGDELNRIRERSGEPFDIKAYDPSDGISRILWKTYARSGELVVRRPEPAIVPEGEVAIFVVAGPDDDHVAGAFLSYLRRLEQQDIAVAFGTDGNAAQPYTPPSMLGRDFYQQPEEIRRALNLAVWSPQAGTSNGFADFLNALQESNRFVQQVVVFIPASAQSLIASLQSAARLANIRLLCVAVPASIAQSMPRQASFQALLARSRSPYERFEASLDALGSRFGKSARRITEQQQIRDLSAAALRSGGEIIVCERGEWL